MERDAGFVRRQRDYYSSKWVQCFSFRLLSLGPLFLALFSLPSQDIIVTRSEQGTSAWKAKQEPGFGMGICKVRNKPASIINEGENSAGTCDQRVIRSIGLSVAFSGQVSIEICYGCEFV